MEILSIETLSYKNIITLVPSFISLDISKTSTGWIKYINGVQTQGTFTIQAPMEDGVGQRREFREFLKDLFQDDEFEYLFIEDTIGSINYKTARTLYQLNPIADDMIADGIIKANNIIREDNKVWKKNLKKCANYKGSIRAESDDKYITRMALLNLGFGDGTTNTIAEDIYDAMGLSIGIIYRIKVLNEQKSVKKLKKDIGKVYKIHQFYDLYEALDDANEVGGEIHQVDFTNIKRDLKFNFKRLIEELDDDTKTFIISIPTSKIGAVALNKGLNLDIPMSYLVVYR